MEEMVMCAICGKEVIRNMEDYVKLDAFHQGKKVGKPIFYHKDCYKDFIQDLKKAEWYENKLMETLNETD